MMEKGQKDVAIGKTVDRHGSDKPLKPQGSQYSEEIQMMSESLHAFFSGA